MILILFLNTNQSSTKTYHFTHMLSIYNLLIYTCLSDLCAHTYHENSDLFFLVTF